jgi:DNA adenine methylase
VRARHWKAIARLPEKEIAISLHGRKQHRQARVIYENPEMFGRVKRAWAVWTLANASFGHQMDSAYGYDRKGGASAGGTSRMLANKRAGFTVDCAVRLQRVRIECCDALRVIECRPFFAVPVCNAVAQCVIVEEAVLTAVSGFF